MTERRGIEALTGSAKSALLQSLTQNAAAPAPRPAVTRLTPKSGPKVWDTSFETLPGFREMRTQQAAAEMFGIANPFYREHGTKAGATSVIGNWPVVNFASYDYLGYNGDPRVTGAAKTAVDSWGTSVSASRITAGERPFHKLLEQDIAALYGVEDALVFVSGHATNISTIAALAGPKDLVVHDELIHNSAVVGVQASGAQRRIFPHNDLDALDVMLTRERDRYDRVLIVTEGLFSMDGDVPDLPRLIEIKQRHGAWLMMDEAHSLGVVGRRGFGLHDHFDIDPQAVDIWMGTLSKTLVSCGGYIAGSHALIDYLKFKAPGMVYSVGMPASAAAAAHAALRLLKSDPGPVERLQANGKLFLTLAKKAGLNTGPSVGLAITPIIIGDSLKTVMLAEALLKAGINAFPIIPPAVPERGARLRFFISASHEREQIERTVAVVAEELGRLSPPLRSVGA